MQPLLKKWLLAEGAQAPLLLTGDSEEILQQTIDRLAQLTVCESEARPCGTCAACRQVAQGMHGDVLIGSRDSKTLAIAEVRSLLRWLTLTATGSRRLAVLPQAERLSVPAANALLKTLEEAPAAVRLMLTTRWPSRLLTTIRSRCQQVRITGKKSDGRKRAGAAKMLDETMPSLLAVTDGQKRAELLEELPAALDQLLRERGPSRDLQATYLRLRDYYRVTAERGNEKLAWEVLVASLPDY